MRTACLRSLHWLHMTSMDTADHQVDALILWAWPRTRSTVFERFFLARSTNDVEVLHEPLSAPIFWSKSRVSALFSEETCNTKYKQYEDTTFESAWHVMTHPPEGKKVVFTKDLAKYIVEVDPSVAMPNARQPPEMKLNGNPTYITADKLLARNVKHVFLIRSIDKSIPSWARLIKTPGVGIGCMEANEVGVQQSVRLYKFLEENLPVPPLIIDSDDLFEHAEDIVRKLCALMNVDFQPCMLEWPDNPVVYEMFAKWQGWHDDVADSRGVCEVRGKGHSWEIDEEIKAAIADNMEGYEYMMQRAYRFDGAEKA